MLIANKGFLHDGKIYKKGDKITDKFSKTEQASLIKGEFVKEVEDEQQFQSDDEGKGKEPEQ